MDGPTLLRAWRERAGHSQVAAARELGVRSATWNEWESGKREPGRDLAVRLEALTKGEVPVESWSQDPRVCEAMAAIRSADRDAPEAA